VFITDIPRSEYADPWKSSFEERVIALGKGQQRVAYLYENPDSSTFRYRIYNMMQVLRESSSNISAAYFTGAELDRLDRVIEVADVLVVCRTKYSDKVNRTISKARALGKPVFFDIDDLVFNTAYVHLVLDALDQDLNQPTIWDVWFAYMGRQGATLNLCDRAITTNAYLAERLHGFTGKPVSVIPNFLNQEQLEISNRIFRAKTLRGFERTSRLHIGYFSGTPSHNKDLEVISGALVDLLQQYPGIVLRVVGFMDLKGPLRNYADRIERYPLQDFVNLQRLIGDTELNLVPLQDNEFTNCKSELKYFEAGIVGTVSVASPIFTLRNAIRDGQNGYLSNSYEWHDKIEHIIRILDTDYIELAKSAYHDSEERYAWYNQTKLVESTLFSS
jgi:glycosyltransferase involved in cell wall biosynthesis